MGKNVNEGASLTVYGDPESFRKLIKNHGLLAKVKQAIACPCVGLNHGSPDFQCDLCAGKGFVYGYQRRFLVADEETPADGKCAHKLNVFNTPILEVVKVQNVASEKQGGITDLTVESYNKDSIVIAENVPRYMKKRVTYYYDGWTLIEDDKLEVDEEHGIMYAPGCKYDAEYQSSNPLNAYADITEIIKLYNKETGKEIEEYKFSGNTITTKENIKADCMYASYYISDLTEIITSDLENTNTSEAYSHDIASGLCRMALYPYWNLSRGDIITLSAVVLYRNELISHTGDLDRLWELEVAELHENILDSNGNRYAIGKDYILKGNGVRWIGEHLPAKGSVLSVRYGYKPSYIVFENNPQPNNLENKKYPTIVFTRSWSKIDKNEVARLLA